MPKTKITCSVFGPRRNPYTLIAKLMKGTGMDAAREVIKEEGDFLAAKLQLNILQQLLPMPELNSAYIQYKIRKELDPRKLVATGEYVNSIAARKKSGGDIIDVNVPDVTHGPSGLSMKELARIHEYGQRKFKETGKGIPPRPHWRPTIRWWRKKRMQAAEQEIDKYVSERVFKRLSAQLGTTKTNINPKKGKK